jgi:uncharacterized membrane protein
LIETVGVEMATDKEDPVLVRFRQMSRPMRLIYARPRTFISLGVGVLVALLVPGSHRLVTRLLFGWDALIAVYLALVYTMMLCNDHHHIRRAAAMQDDGRFVILLVTATGAFASIAAIVSELGAHRGAAELTIAIATIVLSWAAVHTTFALHYAHDYYRHATAGGLQFPSGDTEDHADYWDFVYFSFVIGMTAQVSDVGITDRTIRRTATAHGIVSFIYNTALLALTVNIAASAIAT